MAELRSIIRQYQTQRRVEKAMALVTVVRVQGSSYRQPGARMLISEAGEIVGSVSGGCLERDLIKKAQALFSGVALERFQVFRYDTTEDGEEHETLPSVALGCQGVVEISLEILKPGESHAVLDALVASLEQEKEFTLLTVLEAPPTLRLEGGRSFFEVPAVFRSLEFRSQLEKDLLAIKKPQNKSYLTLDGPVHLLLEKIAPPLRWVIFGASHDAVPLAMLGRFMGWHVTVVDTFSAYTMPERFFDAVDALVKCRASEVSKKIKLDKTFCAVVTHNYYHDLAILKQLLRDDVEYIGLLGPKKKGQLMLEEIKKEISVSEMKSLDRLYSPAGIDAGGEGPHSVALAIITEALAVRSKRDGGFLKNRDAPIHDRELT